MLVVLGMAVKVKLFKTLGEYVAIEVPAEYAAKILDLLSQDLGRSCEDVRDAIRMIERFDTFYDLMRRKFKEYLVPRKDVSNMLRGCVLVDKLKLIKRDGIKLVEIVFDRSISASDILSVLVRNGIDVERI